jgi:predicted TIM-barrel fold metal-dependent hydrolase
MIQQNKGGEKTVDMKIIDVDIHHQMKSHRELLPYLQEPWKSFIGKNGLGLPDRGYPSPVGVNRTDCIPPSGGPPASDAEFLIKDHIEPHHIEFGLLTGHVINLATIHDPDQAIAVAAAVNEHTAEQWLPKHPSFRGSIVVTGLDAHWDASEIEKWAGHPGMAQVLLGSAQRNLLGQRQYHPLYEAAARHELPIAIHPGGEGAGATPPPTPSGYPTRYLEFHTVLSLNYMAHLVSLVCEGVFVKFPKLKFVMLEGGIAWIPHIMWRLDKNYKALRSSVPWLKRLPSEYIREHCFFSTQPIEEPDDQNHLIQLFNMIDAENFLLFSSDYPHWDNDVPLEILRKLSPEKREKIFYANAKQLYKLK